MYSLKSVFILLLHLNKKFSGQGHLDLCNIFSQHVDDIISLFSDMHVANEMYIKRI